MENFDWKHVPLCIHKEWLFSDQLHQLNDRYIPRHAILPNTKVIEFHGFSDASEAVYYYYFFREVVKTYVKWRLIYYAQKPNYIL